MADLILDARAKAPTIRRVVDGEVRIERPPRTAFNKAGHKRWIRMLNSYGNDVFCVLTTAAAEVMPEGKYADSQRRKWRKYGWYPYGKCPLALVLNGELAASQLDESIRKDKPCAPNTCNDMEPCPHTVAEQKIRQDRNFEKNKRMHNAWKSSELKLLEKSNENQSELIAGVLIAVKAQSGAGGDTAAILGAMPEMIAAAIAQTQKGGKNK